MKLKNKKTSYLYNFKPIHNTFRCSAIKFKSHFIILSFFILIAYFAIFFEANNSMYQVILFNILNSNHYQIKNFINKKIPITPEAFRFFLEYDRSFLLRNQKNIIPNYQKVQYHNLVPFHSNGVSKKLIDYRDYFIPRNINIKHFSSYIIQKDKYEFDQSIFIIDSKDSKSKNIYLTNFTLIYAITVCVPTPHLLREIKALFHKEVAFVIFYDNKANRTDLYSLFRIELNNKAFENVYFVDSPRFHVGWGQITLAFTQLVLGAAAVQYFPNSLYVSFHSESDYPLVPNDYILQFLKDKYPNNYIELIPTEIEPKKKLKRKYDFRFFFINKENDQIIKMIRYLFPNKTLPFARWRSSFNWFTITIIDMGKVIETMFQRFELVDYVEYCLIADEIILPTLISEANISNIKPYLRYISWRGIGHKPITFTSLRYPELIYPRCAFWSRKFNYKISSMVLNMLDRHIKYFTPAKTSKYCYKYF